MTDEFDALEECERDLALADQECDRLRVALADAERELERMHGENERLRTQLAIGGAPDSRGLR